MSSHPFKEFFHRRAQSITYGLGLVGLLGMVLLMPPSMPVPMGAAGGSAKELHLSPLPQPGPRIESVLVLALDGLGLATAERGLGDGTLHNLARLAAQGVLVSGLASPEPGTPRWSQLVLSTGLASPLEFQELDSLLAPSEGRDACRVWKRFTERSQPVWSRMESSGQRAALVFWPEAIPRGCSRPTAIHVEGIAQDLPAVHREVHLSPATGWQNLPPSYSPPLQGVLRIVDAEGNEPTRLYLLALDRRNDGHILYDHFLLDSDRDAAEGSVTFRADEWAEFPVLPELGSGAAFRVLAVSRGRVPTVTLYQSPSYHLLARPPAVRADLERRLGPPSPPPDLEAWRKGWLTSDQVIEMGLRQVSWLRQVVEYLYQEQAANLLLVRWTPVRDTAAAIREVAASPESEHRCLLRQVDHEVGTLLRSVDLSRTSVLVLSDHEEVPLQRAVNLPALLGAAGLVPHTPEASGGPDTPSPPVAVVTDGRAAWLRWECPGDGSAIGKAIKALKETAAEVLESASGAPAIEIVEAGPASPGRAHLVLRCREGFDWAMQPDREEILLPHDGGVGPGPGEGFLVAAGRGLRQGVWLGPWETTDVLPLIAALLGLPDPTSVDGRLPEEALAR